MEQARHWIWAKTRKSDLNPHALPARPMNPFGDSWEEQAFAEDAAGALGGCVWPPRSYSCSFCRREFRSAQALGGHMNVHRRDRARMKQADATHSAEVVPWVNALSACASQMCTSSLYSNPNPELSRPQFRLTRVSSPPDGKPIGNKEKSNTTLCFLPPFVNKTDHVLPRPASWSSFMAGKGNREISGLERNETKFKNAIIESRVEEEDCVTEDLLVGFNLLVCRRQTDDNEKGSCKRRRVGEKPSSLIPTLGAVDRCAARSEVLKSCPWPAEELDLELRLGTASKVK